ncbi:MAG TPA: hypothetical protein VMP01_27615 [Pirellulaceae bacterium]|nr:hypothetical protein [Pirellulaceae bacterium]
MARVFQFTVRGLLVAVTLAAVGIAALLNAGGWLEALAWGAVLLVLTSAVLLVVYRREEQRAFWLGFVVFGGMYLALLLYSFTADWKHEPLTANPLHYNSLATTKVTAFVYESAIPDSRRQENVAAPIQAGEMPVKINSNSGNAGAILSSPSPVMADGITVQYGVGPQKVDLTGFVTFTAGQVTTPNPSYIPLGKFISIGHTLWPLLIAAAGGKICQIIYRTRPQQET